MDTGRLGVVRRQENSRRKFVFMLNEAIRSQCDIVDECLDKEKFDIGVKYDKSFVPIRRTVVKQRVLQQCLKMKRANRKYNERNLGVYGGKPLYTFARDIDKFISDMHPRHRRLRQVEKILKESVTKGKILDPQKIPKKIDDYFEKNWKMDEPEVKPKLKKQDIPESTDIFKKTRHILPPIRGLLNPYGKVVNSKLDDENASTVDDTGNIKGDRDNDVENKTLDNSKNESQTNNSKVAIIREKDNSGEYSRKLLILPPIQPTKQMTQR